jgi:hypothetical protein
MTISASKDDKKRGKKPYKTIVDDYRRDLGNRRRMTMRGVRADLRRSTVHYRLCD